MYGLMDDDDIDFGRGDYDDNYDNWDGGVMRPMSMLAVFVCPWPPPLLESHSI